jgi:nucleotide-binding universal stress UspA family protein
MPNTTRSGKPQEASDSPALIDTASFQAGHAIPITDKEVRLVRVNRAYLNLYTFASEEEVLGKTQRAIRSPMTPIRVGGEILGYMGFSLDRARIGPHFAFNILQSTGERECTQDRQGEDMKKILIAFDGSQAAEAALQDLRRAGLPTIAQAKVLTVYPPILSLDALSPNGIVTASYAMAYRDALAHQKSELARALASAKSAARKLKSLFPGWKVTAQSVADVPAHALLDAAAEWRADLIAMGSKGWSGFGRLLIGSVADKVLNHAHCPVRLGRPKAERPSGPPRLLIAYDGSPFSDAAVKEAASRNWPKGTRATLLAVSELQMRMSDMPLALADALGGGKDKSPWPWVEAKLAKAADRLAAKGLEVRTEVVIGEPRDVLLKRAARLGATAIFLGSHGHTGLRRLMLGSVSSSVAAHAPCSVEVIHLQAKGKGKRK